MSTVLAKRESERGVVRFDPDFAKRQKHMLEAGIDYAKKVENWELLDDAVDQMIGFQEEFVNWWSEHVTGRKYRGVQNSADGHVVDLQHGYIPQEIAQERTGIKAPQVSAWRKSLRDRVAYRDKLRGPSYKRAMAARGSAGSDLRGAGGTGDNEWYTPAEYIELARRVLGEIDLDPASSDQAQERVRAGSYFTEDLDGLDAEWHGRVFLNPPYAQPHIASFVSKLVAEFEDGRVTAAVLLTHNYTDTTWFHEAASAARAVCFTRGRIKFESPDGRLAAPTQGQSFFYFGDDVAAFAREFSGVGFVASLEGEWS